MGTAILHNRVIRKGGGMPEYAFDGTHTLIDDGSTSGIWQIALTSTGTLTIGKDAKNVTIQAQGGGGSGGASNGTTKGSDGYDGSIESYEGNLAAGTYSVTIGAGGTRPTNAKGNSGGTTSLGNVLIANGGAGGARAGGATLTHSGLYETYGQGGAGGTTSQYSTSTTAIQWYVTANKATYRYASPDTSSSKLLSISSGANMYVGWASTAPTTITGTDGNQWWKQSDGYLLAADFGSPVKTGGTTTKTYYGNAGNPGIVILSGKA